MTDSVEVLSAELVPSASELVMSARGAVAAAAAPLLAAAERYAACQAAPSTQRTYRSTLRSFALFYERELDLPATVGAVTLDAVLDYTAWLQDLDEATDERAVIRVPWPSSSPRCAASRAGSRCSLVWG